MTLREQTLEERDAGLVEIGRVYQRTDNAAASLLVIMDDGQGYQYADPRVFWHLVLRHCSQRIRTDLRRTVKERD